MWPVGDAWWSMAWGSEQKRGKRRKRGRRKKQRVHVNLLCRWREAKQSNKMGGVLGLVRILNAWQWCNSWDIWVCAEVGGVGKGIRVCVCVWVRVSTDGQKKANIKAQRQNIWLPGNRASSNGSIELWRMVAHGSTSPIRFQDGFRTVSGGVRAVRRADEDREMSPPVRICQGQWTMWLAAEDFVSRALTEAYQQGPSDWATV